MKKLKTKFYGFFGEFAMNVTAKIALRKKNYKLLKNVTLPTSRGTTQIDHIIVSRYGIFVVETKTMTGWIYGSQRDKEWTQKFPGRTFKFQNPLRQNYGHIKELEKLLPDVSPDHFHGVISMCGEHVIKTVMPKEVTRGAWYVRYIKSFRKVVLTEEEVEKIVETIETTRLPPSRETDRQHIANVKMMRQERERKAQEAAASKGSKATPVEDEAPEEEEEAAEMVDGAVLITTSRLAKQLKTTTDELLSNLTESGYLRLAGNRHYLTKKGSKAGGKWKRNRFGGYFLWPDDLNIKV